MAFLLGKGTTRSKSTLTVALFEVIGERYAAMLFPREFTRRARSFTDFVKFKATELRMLLLYGGDHALQGIVGPLALATFRMLSLAIRILSDVDHCEDLNETADSFLQGFLINGCACFGDHFASIGLHLLTHLPEEVMCHGPLDSFSCFKYENCLKYLKKMQTSHKNPLANLSNKLKIRSVFISKPTKTTLNVPEKQELKAVLTRPCEPITQAIRGGTHYKNVKHNNITLTTSVPDCYFSINGEVFQIVDIVEDTAGLVHLICTRFARVESSFFIQMSDESLFYSRTVGVVKLSRMDPTLEVHPLSSVSRKYVVHSHHSLADTFVGYPLIKFC